MTPSAEERCFEAAKPSDIREKDAGSASKLPENRLGMPRKVRALCLETTRLMRRLRVERAIRRL